jgi:formylglycine-generating enzyme required for sulfatase activity
MHFSWTGILLLATGCGAAACHGKGCARSPCPEGMVHIPAGTFEMGIDIPEAYPSEKPVHKVTLSAFCLDRTEVTLDAYDACVKAGKCRQGGGTGLYSCGKLPQHSGRPVNCVTWAQAKEYCEAQAGRLPTEAEWEYAARGTDGRLYPWGDEPPDRTRFWANGGDDRYCPDCPTKVGQYPKGASPFGMLDMIGNVKEWVADYKVQYPAEPQTNPLATVPAEPEFRDRVLRGAHGGYKAADALHSRATIRRSSPESWTHTTVGFRCSKSIEP